MCVSDNTAGTDYSTSIETGQIENPSVSGLLGEGKRVEKRRKRG
jgi:hypothetical protein